MSIQELRNGSQDFGQGVVGWLDCADGSMLPHVNQVFDRKRELKRALMTTNQLVVNRAGILNNPVLAGMISLASKPAHSEQSDQSEAAAIRELFSTGAISIFLMNEEEFDIKNTGSKVYDDSRELDVLRASSWQALLGRKDLEISFFCPIAGELDSVPERFRDRCNRIFDNGETGLDLHEAAQVLGYGRQAVERAARILQDKAAVLDASSFNRGLLYESFEWTEKSNLDHPNMLIKQLIDISYNSNVPDLFGLDYQNGKGCIGKSLLQMDRVVSTNAVGQNKIIDYSSAIFSSIAEAHSALKPGSLSGYLFDFGSLSFSQIARIRSSMEWQAYMAASSRIRYSLLAAEAPDPHAYRKLVSDAESKFSEYMASIGQTMFANAMSAIDGIPVTQLTLKVGGKIISAALGGALDILPEGVRIPFLGEALRTARDISREVIVTLEKGYWRREGGAYVRQVAYELHRAVFDQSNDKAALRDLNRDITKEFRTVLRQLSKTTSERVKQIPDVAYLYTPTQNEADG